MKVMKFGGTSVGSAANIANVKKIISGVNEPIVVVVSAFKSITDKLLTTSQLAAAGDYSYEREFREIVEQHVTVVCKLDISESQREKLAVEVNKLLDELSNIFKGVFLINDLSPKTSDKIVSYGERLSTLIISYAFSDYEMLDVTQLIKTDCAFGKHTPDMELSNKLIRNAFENSSKKVLVAGFISTCKTTGEITNLGRGGSDYTAAIFASALDANILEIWSDVDGFMSADPKVINNAHVIESLTFTEATELCNFGAKVIYPPTIFPVYHKNIPIRIKNTFKPDAPGTYISHNGETRKSKAMIKGISSISDSCLITVQGLGMVGIIGVNFRIFRALAKNGISVFLVSQASSENSTSIGVRSADATLAVRVLEEEFEKEISLGSINRVLLETELATVAIVGENMKYTPGIAGKLFETLGKSGISVIACAQGASEVNISFVIKNKYLRKALNSIHDSFFLSEYKALNLFIVGIGTVGGNLIEQIRQQQPKLMEQYALKLNVVGIARGRKALFCREGINLDNYKTELDEKGIPSSPEILRDGIINMNIFNAVFVDCTASEPVSQIYGDLMSQNISVVTANKVAASSAYDNYIKLKNTARERNIKFLFETNVGAGLPIINTMNSLINSGDKIVKIEAVLSGTLNFIFNTISKDIPFSKAIYLAKESGYSEPDPRIDLSGMDVVRKLVILTREAGYQVEQADVEKNLFVPQEYFNGTIEEFWANIRQLDSEFEERRKKLESEHKHLRFVAKYENGKCEVGLQEVGQNHPFYDLEGSNNIIQITTERYNEYPMIIKGYGAGASVTAAGVFSDIISIANIR
ncbi:MAG: bifunctional aspartate kinase/homoserine dehydrogenase I [Prevotella sp.]|uniref:bifunctional aspartate kinase/homoserine dehydrogenase I n=1 Tax=unclassified Dysgonomonas TaxID=2630389 RepID=UPI0025BE686B|nr:MULTISPECIES: bifunctional aspartate kinase/homoserine dehydrogenase I [unclassified Dysgonomonas]MDR1717259.1 bifunctional aspartate kinase/homoserine dehydrogenase I [Prevotella sp.]MDR2001589.1 bifunctional aspartate kinase/homoserine dehydrogenase I [Prevotella sp.]HMM04610.1 bifunctional aspartate kinase/homoserine dehydrogenase I [Dysgonomonas sp.]